MSEPTLDAIGLHYGTDKASSHHDYLAFYETFLAPLRSHPLKVLEIGVFNGASLKTWEAYFPQATIIGADIMPHTRQFQRGRVFIELLDQSNLEELTRLAIKHGPFDLIIEDGSHMWEHQTTSLRTLFPFLADDGLYIVEDLQTNYGPMQAAYRGVARSTCVDFLKSWLDLRVGDDQIAIDDVEDAFLRTYGRAAQFLTFYRRACLIRKRYVPIPRDAAAGLAIIAVQPDAAFVPVRILAHLGMMGDVFGTAGFVNPAGDAAAFQGLSIDVADDLVQYRSCPPEGSWSDWRHGGDFTGTRGQAQTLRGVAVRLRADVADRYALRVIGRFAGQPHPVAVADGQDCTSPDGAALCGLQIELSRR